MIYCPNRKNNPQLCEEICQACIERGDPRCRKRKAKGKGYTCPIADRLIKEMKMQKKEKETMGKQLFKPLYPIQTNLFDLGGLGGLADGE